MRKNRDSVRTCRLLWMKKRSVEVWIFFCVTLRILLTPQKCRQFEDPKNILRNTGSFGGSPRGFLGQVFFRFLLILLSSFSV